MLVIKLKLSADIPRTRNIDKKLATLAVHLIDAFDSNAQIAHVHSTAIANNSTLVE